MPGRVTGQSGFARSFRDGDEANWTRGAYAFGSGAGARSRSRSRILARTRTDCRIQVSVLRHAGTVKGQRGISGSPGFSVGGGYRPVAKSNALFFNRSLSLAQPPKGSQCRSGFATRYLEFSRSCPRDCFSTVYDWREFDVMVFDVRGTCRGSPWSRSLPLWSSAARQLLCDDSLLLGNRFPIWSEEVPRSDSLSRK